MMTHKYELSENNDNYLLWPPPIVVIFFVHKNIPIVQIKNYYIVYTHFETI